MIKYLKKVKIIFTFLSIITPFELLISFKLALIFYCFLFGNKIRQDLIFKIRFWILSFCWPRLQKRHYRFNLPFKLDLILAVVLLLTKLFYCLTFSQLHTDAIITRWFFLFRILAICSQHVAQFLNEICRISESHCYHDLE
jgi:hypothetical protein